MAKKKVNKQSVRESAKQRREREQQQKRARQNQIIIAIASILLLIVVVFAVTQILGGDDDGGDEASAGAAAGTSDTLLDGDRPLAAMAPAERNNYYSAYPDMVIDTEKSYEAVIRLEKGGEMRLRLFADAAPLTVNSFVFLATQGFYDGVIFHRVLENFMAQGGDPTGTGTGGPGYEFVNETSPDLLFDRRGLLAMANAGPDTNGSQFFITFGPQPNLNGGYTIFGELIEGDNTLSSITLVNPQFETGGDVIERIDIYEN